MKNQPEQLDKKPIVLYSVGDICRMFHCGSDKARKLMSLDGFPAIKIRKRIYVEHDALHKWLDVNQGKNIVW
mgnify:CR=1 FL=1